MKEFLQSLREVFEFWCWVPRIAWRMVNGRWYIFRDVPMHVVAVFAGWADRDDLDEDTHALTQQAVAEIKLRLQRAERALERGETPNLD